MREMLSMHLTRTGLSYFPKEIGLCLRFCNRLPWIYIKLNTGLTIAAAAAARQHWQHRQQDDNSWQQLNHLALCKFNYYHFIIGNINTNERPPLLTLSLSLSLSIRLLHAVPISCAQSISLRPLVRVLFMALMAIGQMATAIGKARTEGRLQAAPIGALSLPLSPSVSHSNCIAHYHCILLKLYYSCYCCCQYNQLVQLFMQLFSPLAGRSGLRHSILIMASVAKF